MVPVIYPRAVIAVVEGLSIHLHEWLATGRIDLALIFDPPRASHLAYELLRKEALRLVFPPNQRPTGTGRVSLDDLLRFPLILPSAPNSLRMVVDEALNSRAENLRLVAEVSSVQTALELVSKNLGYTLLLKSALASLDPYSKLVHLPLGPPHMHTRLMLARLRNPVSGQLIEGLIETIRLMKW